MKSSSLAKALFPVLVILLMVTTPDAGAKPTDPADPPDRVAGPREGEPEVDPAVFIQDPLFDPSYSPYLTGPMEELDWPPVEFPEIRESVWMADPTATVVYDLRTGKETVIPSSARGRLAPGAVREPVPPFAGLLPTQEPPETDTIFPPDGRVRITPTTSFPWRTLVKLGLSFPDGGGGGCSGAMVDAFHVLTAGHCIYSHDHGGWATQVKVIPGLDGTSVRPYHHAYSTILRSYTAWTEDGSWYHDWGLITLDRNVGNFTGWMGRLTTTDLTYYEGFFHLAGYPGDLGGGYELYYDGDYGHFASETNHFYWMDMKEGQSGAPVWDHQDPNRYIVSINTNNAGGAGSNIGCRLNQDKYDMLTLWLTEDTPPVDRADLLDDGPPYSGFTPTTVVPGVSGFNVWCDVRNVGTASSGVFHVYYYASGDNIITPADYLIGTDIVASIPPFSKTDSAWIGTFPLGLAAGTYYVGWIVDGGYVVTEFDEDNNIAYNSPEKLVVETPDHTISGTVRDMDRNPIPGVLISGLPGNPVTAEDGTYSATVSHGWAGTSEPIECYDFSPSSRNYAVVLSNYNNQDFQGAPLDCSYMTDQCNDGFCDPAIGICQADPRPDETPCDDGYWCTVDDLCLSGNCGGAPRDCSDGVDCTGDFCNDWIDSCVNTPRDSLCDDDLWCNGAEFCDPESGCQNGTPPDCGDDGIFCNGTDFCDEETDQCGHTGSRCRTGQGQACGPGWEECDEENDRCVTSLEECPDDGLFCNGDEYCSALAAICVHGSEPCTDDGIFCNGEEICDEANDQCGHTGTPCPDDGVFCNGDESCSEEILDCLHSGDPCASEAPCCDEDADECVPIQVTIDEPQTGLEYPAGAVLQIEWSSDQDWCLDAFDVYARYHHGGTFTDELVASGPPQYALTMDAHVVDLDEAEILVGAYHGNVGWTEPSGSFALRVPGSLSIVSETDAGELTLSWEGFEADILVLDGPYDPSFTGATLMASVASPWTDTDAGLSSERYYRILNAGTSAASPVSLGKRDIPVLTGYNLLAVPLIYDEELWASEIAADMAAQGGVLYELSMWNAASGTWSTFDPDWPLVDFTVGPGQGFFAKVGNDFTWTVAGEVVRGDRIPINTVYGYAMFGVPTWEFDWASVLAVAMMDQGCAPLEISRWLASAGVWETHDVTWPVVDFAIDAADGYFVKAAEDAVFTLDPMNVQAQVISFTEAQVTFDTDVAGVAFLKLGTDPGSMNDWAFDDRYSLYEGTDHVFTLSGLIEGETYYYEILFLGETFEDAGGPFAFEME